MATLRRYFRLLEQRDIDTWIELWAERCTISMPYAVAGMPGLLTGRNDVHDFYREQAARYRSLSYPGTVLLPMEAPGRVLARWYPHGELHGGGSYRNENLGVFDLDPDGRIRHLVEYFGPAGLLRSPGGTVR